MNQVNELDFVHLHVHSEFSLVDGIIRVKELVNNSADRGFHSVALTDLTNLFGLLEFYRTARERGIKPIVCLLYTSPSPRDRTRSRMPSSA